MCLEHWGRLRAAIEVRGLDCFAASNGKDAARYLKAQAAGEPTEYYDPLMTAYLAICTYAVACGGCYLLHGNYCPLCEVDKHPESGTNSEGWVNDACDGVLKQARAMRLVPPLQ